MEQAQEKKVLPLPGSQIISVNGRKKLDSIKATFPNLEIIVGQAVDGDKPVSLDLGELSDNMQRSFDAATISIFGDRVDRFEKPRNFPYSMVIWLVGFLTGIGATFFVYNI